MGTGFTLITTALRRLRQEDRHEFKTSLHSECWASLSYGVRSCLKAKETNKQKQQKKYCESFQSVLYDTADDIVAYIFFSFLSFKQFYLFLLYVYVES